MIFILGNYNSEKGLLVGGVIGKDCNSMYLKMTAGDMPVGAPQFYHVKSDGKLHAEQKPGTSLIAKEWLAHLKTMYPDLETAYDKGIIHTISLGITIFDVLFIILSLILLLFNRRASNWI